MGDQGPTPHANVMNGKKLMDMFNIVILKVLKDWITLLTHLLAFIYIREIDAPVFDLNVSLDHSVEDHNFFEWKQMVPKCINNHENMWLVYPILINNLFYTM